MIFHKTLERNRWSIPYDDEELPVFNFKIKVKKKSDFQDF